MFWDLEGGEVMGDNRLIVHICGPERLTAEVIELYESEYETEMRCARCGVRLQPGDQKDHFWPYFDDDNRCQKCLQKELFNK